ncbi:AraC family transcriptional regulator [Sphingomonas sp. UV9]|uniref:AraC family transcriptional regulator n=1 Tax=Sphingomonas sp. UV9 TaxID=1851410 RepID=UPI000FFB8B5D|nr:AraC family transcriptional regulator [Sphingomonas sp. UV9]RXD04790.1 AraC family transcriptional regulator [Sphingomonas sp. UV9]
MKDLLEQMRDRALRHTDQSQMTTAVPRLSIAIFRGAPVPENTMCGVGICLVVQGRKQLSLGEEFLIQGRGRSFASLVELPATRCLYETRLREPYVAVGLTIDRSLLRQLLAETSGPIGVPPTESFSLDDSSSALLEAWNQHMALLDAPADVPALAVPRERELLYRLLQSRHGGLLRQYARDDGVLTQINRVIDWMRAHFDQPLPARTLAGLAGMSLPAFNRHFRQATATSPLQYQKALRLQAARHLLSRDNGVSQAARAVGYESASQFSREYSRTFHRSPKQDALFMREGEKGLLNVMI